jgi:hypothetical protein
MKVVCDNAFCNPWVCQHCKEARPHEPVLARVGTRVELWCNEVSRICTENQIVVKCISVNPSKDDVNNC